MFDEPARDGLVLGSILFPLFPRGEESVGVEAMLIRILTRAGLAGLRFRPARLLPIFAGCLNLRGGSELFRGCGGRTAVSRGVGI